MSHSQIQVRGYHLQFMTMLDLFNARYLEFYYVEARWMGWKIVHF